MREGTPLLLTTPYLEEAYLLADRIAFLALTGHGDETGADQDTAENGADAADSSPSSGRKDALVHDRSGGRR